MSKEVKKWMSMKQVITLDLKNQEEPPLHSIRVRFKIPSDKSPKLERKRGRKLSKERNRNK
jgi:hypothetical protein